MRLLLNTSILISTMFTATLITATPVVDITTSPAITTHAAYPAVTHYYAADGSRLATIKATDTVNVGTLQSLAALANDEVVVKAFEAAVAITSVACYAGPPLGCIAVALTSVIGVFFLAYATSGKRDFEFDLNIASRSGRYRVFNLDYPPTSGYSARYLLEHEAPEGDWRLVGNATVDGVFHAIHYKRDGTLNGLRAVQYPYKYLDRTKRAEDNDGGVVVDYHWNSLSESAYDSFHSTTTLIDDFSDDILADFEDVGAIFGCADFGDSDGYLDAGLVSIGWNNQPFQFTADGEEQGLINECGTID